MWLNTFVSSHKFSEVIYDYKGQVSFGRVGALLCLLFAQSLACAGFFFPANEKMLSYCSTLSLQFLGAAVSLYIPSKATETFSKKWAPTISDTVTKVVAGTPPVEAAKEAVKEAAEPSGKATDD